MTSINRLILFNQMAGPLFRQLAEDLAPLYPGGCLLFTGHPDISGQVGIAAHGLVIKMAPAYNRESKLGRLNSWVKYTASATRYVLLARRGDAILLVSNPPLLGPWVWLLSLLRRVPFVVLVYDIHPDVLVCHGVLPESGLVTRVWRWVNRRVYRRAKAVITIGHRMAGVLQREIGLDAKKVVVIPPWVDVNVIKPIARKGNPYIDRFGVANRFVVLYSGNMGASHDINSMLEAARILKDDERILFIFIGDGEKRSEVLTYIKHHALNNIRVYEFQPEEMISFTHSLGHLSLVSLDRGMEELMLPSKTFTYFAVGSPVIAIAREDSELVDIITKGACGVAVPPGKPEWLAESIARLASDPELLSSMRENARIVAERYYSREGGVRKFTTVLKNVGLVSMPENKEIKNV